MLHEPNQAQIQKNPPSNSIIEELPPIKCKHPTERVQLHESNFFENLTWTIEISCEQYPYRF